MGYTRLAFTSLSWVTAYRVFYRSLAFIRTLIIARLLSPQQFGEFGITALVLALVEMLTETGINVFLVQQRDENAVNTHTNTAWVVSILRGFIISSIVVGTSGLVSQFFHAEGAQPLLMLMGLVPLIRGFINPAIAKFQKHLQFDKEFLLRSSCTITDTIIAIGFTYLLHSPIGLIVGLIASALVEVAMSMIFVKPRPQFIFDLSQFRQIIKSGKWITSAGILSYFANNAVDTSVGKLLSTQSLGFYQMAYKVSILFIDELTELVNRVAFPLYTKISFDRDRLRKAFFKTAGSYLALGLFILTNVYLFIPILVPLLLGDRWLNVIPIIRQLTIFGLSIVLTVPTNPLFLAAKKQQFLTYTLLNQIIVIIIGLLLILPHPNLNSIILVATIGMLSTLPLRIIFAYRLLKP